MAQESEGADGNSAAKSVVAEDRRGERMGFLVCLAIFLSVVGVAVTQWIQDHKPIATNSPTAEKPASGSGAPLEASGAIHHITATVHMSDLRQRWEGFGAAVAYYQNWVVAHPNKAEIYDALFKGLNLNILRLRNIYQPGANNDFAKADVEVVRGAEQAHGQPITIVMSSWSPPAALKSNRSEKQGGTLAKINGEFDYAGFGRYWHDSLVAYRKIGISPAWISIQNEPDWKADWESCLFQPEQQGGDKAVYGEALGAVETALKTLPEPPALMGPETLGIGGGNPEHYLPPTNAARLARVGALAHHLYSGGTHKEPDSFIPRMRALRQSYPDKLRFQTEFGRSDGFQTAWIIHNSLTEEEAHAYVYWAAAWPGPDCLITLDNPWKQSEWKNPKGFLLTDRYYGLQHYSAFIEKGYQRVQCSAEDTALRISAFLSPDRSRLVIVALNTATDHTVDLSVEMPGFSRDSTVTLYRTCQVQGEKFLRLSTPTPGGGWILPPHSIVTAVVETRK